MSSRIDFETQWPRDGPADSLLVKAIKSIQRCRLLQNQFDDPWSSQRPLVSVGVKLHPESYSLYRKTGLFFSIVRCCNVVFNKLRKFSTCLSLTTKDVIHKNSPTSQFFFRENFRNNYQNELFRLQELRYKKKQSLNFQGSLEFIVFSHI